MTKEGEAVKWLEAELHTWEIKCNSQHPVKDALKMAIKELKQGKDNQEEISSCMACPHSHITLNNYMRCKLTGNCYIPSVMINKISEVCPIKSSINSTKEQQSCRNTVSIQTVKEQMLKYGFHSPDMTVTEFVEGLTQS